MRRYMITRLVQTNGGELQAYIGVSLLDSSALEALTPGRQTAPRAANK